MAKLTNKKLLEAKNNQYAVYTFGEDGRRLGTVGGCNILRVIEEAKGHLSFVYSQELHHAIVPRELYEELGLRDSAKTQGPVWFWLLEVEAEQKQRATWQQVKKIYDYAEALLKHQAQGGQNNEG